MRVMLLGFFIGLGIFSCAERTPQETKVSSNKDYSVDLLFNIDGCNVYRFQDGEAVYLTICHNDAHLQSRYCHMEGKANRCHKQIEDVQK